MWGYSRASWSCEMVRDFCEKRGFHGHKEEIWRDATLNPPSRNIGESTISKRATAQQWINRSLFSQNRSYSGSHFSQLSRKQCMIILFCFEVMEAQEGCIFPLILTLSLRNRASMRCPLTMSGSISNFPLSLHRILHTRLPYPHILVCYGVSAMLMSATLNTVRVRRSNL